MLWFQWGGIASDFWNERLDERTVDGLEVLTPEDKGSLLEATHPQNLRSEDFVLAYAGCDLTETPWAVWKDRVMFAVEQRLSEIKASAVCRASLAGFTRVTPEEKRSPSKDHKVQNYHDWFVSFQLCTEG